MNPIPIIRLDNVADRARMVDMLKAVGIKHPWHMEDLHLSDYPYIAADNAIHLFTDDEGPRASKYLQDRPTTLLNSPHQMIAYIKRMRRV